MKQGMQVIDLHALHFILTYANSVMAASRTVPSRFMRKIVCRLRLSEVSRQ